MRKLSNGTFLLEGATNVGVYVSDVVYLIDTGGSRKNLRQVMEEFEGREIIVLNTHHHADHIALNGWLQKKTSCRIHAPAGEISMISQPLLEGALLFGAYPPRSLRSSFFRADPSKVEPLPEDLPLEVVPLPGHTISHTGYLTPGGVLFSGDLFFSKEIVQKYFYPYHQSISLLRETLKSLEEIEFRIVVPSHGKPTSDPSTDISFMMERVEEIEDRAIRALESGDTCDSLTIKLSDVFDLKLEGGFWHLFRSFVCSILEDLEEMGRVREESGKWFKE